MPGSLTWGWYPTDKKWVPLRVDADGSIHVVGYVDKLNDIGDVNVPAPTDGYFLYWDDAASKWQCTALAEGDIPAAIARDVEVADAITAHADLITGIHGVGARHIAETSVADLDLAAHKTRHQNGGDDEISVAGLSGQLADAQTPKSHGADKHTNVARHLFIPACEGWMSGGTITQLGYYPVWQGEANTDTPRGYLSMKIPDDFVSFTTLKAVWVSTAGAANNMYWYFIARYGSAGEHHEAHSQSPAAGPTASAGNNLFNVQEAANPLTLPNLAKADYLGIHFRRLGSDPQDTLNAQAFLFGLLFSYLGEQ